MQLSELTVRGFADLLGSDAPAPGGGSAAALAGALGAALTTTEMVSAKALTYGDFSRYWVRLVNSIRVERSEHFLFGSDQIAFRGVVRGDGNLVDTGAVKAFVGA